MIGQNRVAAVLSLSLIPNMWLTTANVLGEEVSAVNEWKPMTVQQRGRVIYLVRKEMMEIQL